MPSRENSSPGDASFNLSSAGSYLILIVDAENKSATLSTCTLTFTVAPCLASTVAGANLTCAWPGCEGAAGGTGTVADGVAVCGTVAGGAAAAGVIEGAFVDGGFVEGAFPAGGFAAAGASSAFGA